MFHISRPMVLLIVFAFLTLNSATSASYVEPRSSKSCTECCTGLSKICEGCVSYLNDAVYTKEQKTYWSQQQQQTYPHCRFTPRDASDVSAAVREIRKAQCPFAVKSGGHASFKGGSNIDSAVAIDLSGLTSIDVSSDKTVTSVGSGNRWEDVYRNLDKVNLAVIGGRNGDIGVGGLTLGGGISFFSGPHGWACDNVKNYEVVIANGSIVNANTETNPDLFHALRGGGNNFGIVTRFDLNTFQHGQMWGGMTVYPLADNKSMYDAFYWFNENGADDPKAALIVAAACVAGEGCFFSNDYEYIAPVVEPPIFENFTKIANLSSSARITNLLNLTVELKDTQPRGFRQRFFALTFKNDAHLLSEVLNAWYEEIQPIINITDFLPSLIFQPLTIPVIEHMQKNGGNALGITPAEGPLTIMNIDFQWGLKSDDSVVLDAQNTIISKSIALAKARGLYNRYIYQNYAYITQDVFDGYGQASKDRLLQTQKAYDPEHVFLDLQPGYFKLRP